MFRQTTNLRVRLGILVILSEIAVTGVIES
jgi:hypothetical protein